jgi:hypothetical protein
VWVNRENGHLPSLFDFNEEQTEKAELWEDKGGVIWLLYTHIKQK